MENHVRFSYAFRNNKRGGYVRPVSGTVGLDADGTACSFPFRHSVEMTATLLSANLTIETPIIALDTVPVSFGFHPYFGIPGLPRDQ